MVEQFREVGKGLLMEGFVSEENFELNPLFNREPIVFMGTSVGEQAGSRFLDVQCMVNAGIMVSAVEKESDQCR